MVVACGQLHTSSATAVDACVRSSYPPVLHGITLGGQCRTYLEFIRESSMRTTIARHVVACLLGALQLQFTWQSGAQCVVCGPTDPDQGCGETLRFCVAQDDGTGTVAAPVSMREFNAGRYILRAGLPLGATIKCQSRVSGFWDICPPVNINCYSVASPPTGWTSTSFRAT